MRRDSVSFQCIIITNVCAVLIILFTAARTRMASSSNSGSGSAPLRFPPTRRVLLPALEPGWDENVDAEDRPLVNEVLSMAREIARFKQPRAAPAGPDDAHEQTVLRGRGGGGGGGNVNAMDIDDDSNDALDIDAPRGAGAGAGADDDSIQYAITRDPASQYYTISILVPIDTLFTLNRLMHLCSPSYPRIHSNTISLGWDLDMQCPFINVRVDKRANLVHFAERIVIIEQLGGGAVDRITGGLPLSDGVSVRRTADGTVISSQSSARASKRARMNPQ